MSNETRMFTIAALGVKRQVLEAAAKSAQTTSPSKTFLPARATLGMEVALNRSPLSLTYIIMLALECLYREHCVLHPAENSSRHSLPLRLWRQWARWPPLISFPAPPVHNVVDLQMWMTV